MNPIRCTAEHFARIGFEVVDPLDIEWWLLREYRV